MTKEHSLAAYAHFRDLEKNYVPKPGMNSGPTAEHRVKKKAKRSADILLAKYPDFESEAGNLNVVTEEEKKKMDKVVKKLDSKSKEEK